MEEYLTVKEARDLLKVSEKTIRSWIKQRKLPVFRINRTMRVPRRAIEAYVHYPSPVDKRTTQNRQAIFERLHKLRQRLANRQGVLSNLILEAREELEANG
ncbi:helix-turn-helix domain-containing protein [Candidatus Poribacteria bacterium]|nr:helix-turn-helix domain-containing protein [Candidatus Poribacteria bacterium]